MKNYSGFSNYELLSISFSSRLSPLSSPAFSFSSLAFLREKQDPSSLAFILYTTSGGGLWSSN